MPPDKTQRFEFAAVERRFNLIKSDAFAGLNVSEVLDERNFQECLSFFQQRVRLIMPDVYDNDSVDIEPHDKPKTESEWRQKQEDAVRSLLLTFYGTAFTPDTLIRLCWRFAAGWQLLCRGQELEGAFRKTPSEWVSLRIEDCRHGRPSKAGKPMADVDFRVLGGPYAGLMFTQYIGYKFLIRKLARDIGFPAFQTIHKNELVLAWLAGFLVFDDAGKPRVEEFHATSSVLTHNRALRKLRATECHEGFAWPCHSCPKGHADWAQACKRATHPAQLIKLDCRKCGQMDTWFDPAYGLSACLVCATLEARHLVKREMR